MIIIEDVLKNINFDDNIEIQQIYEKLELMKRRKEILSSHLKNHSVTQRKDGRWTTYVPDSSKKNGLKLIVRVNKEDLEDAIFEHYNNLLFDYNPTLLELYNEWITFKINNELIKKQTKDRLDRIVKQCLLEEFGNRKIKNISEYDIEEFLINTIHDKQLTQKSYSNLRTIFYGVFKLAKKKKLVNYSITYVIKDMDISRNNFRNSKRTDYELAYPNNERITYMNYLKDNLDDNRNCAILLCFVSGLRPGELVALRNKDIDTINNIIHVRVSEQRYKDENGKDYYEVSNCKTECSVRDVYVNKEYNSLLKRIKMLNPFGEYCFIRNGSRMKVYILDQKNETNFNKLGLIRRSLNKIRKTYASYLESKGLDPKFIQSQMGHEDYTTTQKYYIKDIHTSEEKSEMINSIAMM